jgi:Domain of unknown function (DUF6484)
MVVEPAVVEDDTAREFAELLTAHVAGDRDAASSAGAGGAVVATLVGFAADSMREARPARTTVELTRSDLAREVVVVFEGGDARRPIVVGRLRDISATQSPGPRQLDIKSDGQRVVVSAPAELVLQCGKASITLTRAGKVLIQGEYVSNRSAGVMRIKGGAVEIN